MILSFTHTLTLVSFHLPILPPWFSLGFPLVFPHIFPVLDVDVCWLHLAPPGPCCTQILGDLGAEITKLERPKVGDDTRGFAPPFLPGAEEAAAGSWGLG